MRLLFTVFLGLLFSEPLSGQKLDGIEKLLGKNMTVVYKNTKLSGINPAMIIMFEDTSINIKPEKEKPIHPSLTLCFFPSSQKENIQKEINEKKLQSECNLEVYEELQNFLILVNKCESGLHCPGIDCLLFRYTIKSALYKYFKIDRPVGPGYGNN